MKLEKSGKSRLEVGDAKIETLKEGQKMKLSLGASAKPKRTPRTRGGRGLRAPGGGLRAPPGSSAPAPVPATAGEDDLLGGLTSGMAGVSVSQTPAPAPAPASDDPWAPF